MLSDFYKNEDSDKVWWVSDTETIGTMMFSFDKETIFNLWTDYPYKLTKGQKEIFDKENPFWAKFFNDRK